MHPDDLQGFASAARRFGPLGSASLDAITTLLQPREFAAGAWLLQAGERAQWGHFIAEGLVRELYIDEEGHEHTRAFAEEGRFTGSLLDLLSGRPSVTWVQAIEPTRTLAFRHADFDALCAEHAELNMLARRVAEQLYIHKAEREHELLALPAAQRYVQWRARAPGLEARVSLRMLASYLGITPEHLSRLRRSPRAAP